MAPFRTAINVSRGPLFKMMTMGSLQNTTGNRRDRQKLVSTKKGIENLITGSLLEVRPMTIDKLQGLDSKTNTVDEWLSGDIKEDVMGALEQGAGKNDDYLIIAVSSEGTVRNGPGDDIKMELDKILKGEYEDEHTSIWWYKLDDVSEVGNPALWLKANPNIGYTVSYDAYTKDVKRSEHVPSARNDILAKRFGLPLEGYTYFFTYSETKAVERHLNFNGRICAMGSDLSQGDDFCAFTFLFPLGGDHYGIKTRSYISSLTLMRLPPSLRMKYEEFRKEGSLEVIDCNVLNMNTVYQDLEQFIQAHGYQVLAHGYDPYNADEFIKNWAGFHGPFGIECVKQGAKTETVPLGELKTLASERLLEFDEQLMEFTMGNCITLEDTNGNRKLLKRRREEKIDNVAALLDAWVAYKRNYDVFDM
jgi:phage terminase large subunit-like protein